jgi:hypothetical protein
MLLEDCGRDNFDRGAGARLRANWALPRQADRKDNNWKTRQWSVPVKLTQILKIGNQPLSLQAGVRTRPTLPTASVPRTGVTGSS